jgi:hypothetical protein
MAELHHSACPWDFANRLGEKSSSFPIFTNPLSAVTRRSPVPSSRTLATVPEFRAAEVCPLFDHLQGPHAPPPPPQQVFSPFENTRRMKSLISASILKNSAFLSSFVPEGGG